MTGLTLQQRLTFLQPIHNLQPDDVTFVKRKPRVVVCYKVTLCNHIVWVLRGRKTFQQQDMTTFLGMWEAILCLCLWDDMIIYVVIGVWLEKNELWCMCGFAVCTVPFWSHWWRCQWDVWLAMLWLRTRSASRWSDWTPACSQMGWSQTGCLRN